MGWASRRRAPAPTSRGPGCRCSWRRSSAITIGARGSGRPSNDGQAHTAVEAGHATASRGARASALTGTTMDGFSVPIPTEISPPLLHPFRSAAGEHVLVVPYTSIYDVAPQTGNGGITSAELERLAEGLAAPIDDDVSLALVPEPAPQSVSLNVSTSCNL